VSVDAESCHMDLLRRVNPFWFGAGALLVWFAVDEIVAYHQARVTRWLGGPLSLAGMIVAALVGVIIVYTLGIEEPPEEPVAEAPASDVETE